MKKNLSVLVKEVMVRRNRPTTVTVRCPNPACGQKKDVDYEAADDGEMTICNSCGEEFSTSKRNQVEEAISRRDLLKGGAIVGGGVAGKAIYDKSKEAGKALADTKVKPEPVKSIVPTR